MKRRKMNGGRRDGPGGGAQSSLPYSGLSGKEYGLLMRERALARKGKVLPTPSYVKLVSDLTITSVGLDIPAEVCYHKTVRRHDRTCECLRCYEVVRRRI